MSTISYADPKAPAPTLGSLGSGDEDHQTRVRQAACVPLIIMIGANLIFFVQYWLPETSRFPTRHWWLTQLAPLASKALTSSNEAQVEAQNGPWGLTALILLAASFAVYGVCRSPRLWLGPWLLAVPALLGLAAGLFIVIALIISGDLTSSLFERAAARSRGSWPPRSRPSARSSTPRRRCAGRPCAPGCRCSPRTSWSGRCPPRSAAGCSPRNCATPPPACRATRSRSGSPRCGHPSPACSTCAA